MVKAYSVSFLVAVISVYLFGSVLFTAWLHGTMCVGWLPAGVDVIQGPGQSTRCHSAQHDLLLTTLPLSLVQI